MIYIRRRYDYHLARVDTFGTNEGLAADPAFDAYVRRINGETVPPPERPPIQGDLETRLAEFERGASKTPQQWLTDWANAGPELDTAENMALTVSAVGLVAEQRALH
jgi:hypothetical protein